MLLEVVGYVCSSRCSLLLNLRFGQHDNPVNNVDAAL